MRSDSFVLGACVNLAPPGRPIPMVWGKERLQPVIIRATAMVDIKAGQVIDIDVTTGHATLATPTV